MKNFTKLSLLILLSLSFTFTSCKDEEEPEPTDIRDQIVGVYAYDNDYYEYDGGTTDTYTGTIEIKKSETSEDAIVFFRRWRDHWKRC
jgi:hypothetical protein